MFTNLLKSSPKGDIITIVYTMIDYKFKVMHDEDDTLNLSAMIHNGKAYAREENKLGCES